MNETTERMLYRMKCKHYVEGSEFCALRSRVYYGWHLLSPCDGDCRRMKNYDKKIKQNEKE